jgi:hypothetical protein
VPQDVALQPEQPPPVAIALLPVPTKLLSPVLNAQHDIFFRIFSDLHFGQVTCSDLENTMVSN